MVVIYIVLGYLAYGYMNEVTIYIYSGFGDLFLHKLIMGMFFGWVFIPLALVKLIFRSIVNK